jgi:hypothetical protein
MPLSNKRTVGLPSPHPVGLQNHCSALLVSPPLRLCQATAPRQIHALPGSPPLGCTGPQPWARSTFCWDLSPLILSPLRPYWAPVPCGMTRAMLCWVPHPLGPAGFLPHWDCHSSGPDTSHTPQPTRIPDPWEEPGPSSTGFPNNYPTRLLHRPPLSGSKSA